MIAKRAVLGCLALAMSVCMWTSGTAAGNDGERVYDGSCRRCHGAEGRGATAPALIPFKWSDEQALKLIREPECDMPAFSKSDLSDEQVADILAYLKTIK